MINLIACVTNYKNKLAIGRGGNLLFKLKDDMIFFKNITTEMLSPMSKLSKNIVLMGRKTYFSIPSKYRPLKNRINLVLTRDPELLKLSPIPKDLSLVKDVYYTDLDTFKRVYIKYNPNVFIVGGSELYNMFLGQADRLYITHVQTNDCKDIKFNIGEEPDTFMNHFNAEYKLVGMTEKYNYNSLSYRILYYNLSKKMSEEYKYLNMMNNILTNGNERIDRTGVGTISMFGTQMRYDISQTIPLLTTKRVPFKTIVEELLWFCRGDSDAKILQKKGIKIWNGNTSRDFLDKRGLYHYPEGIIGPQYGFLWRHFGAKYSSSFADTSQVDTSLIGGFDQLKYVEDLLKNDPFSRRIMISAWSPDRLDEQVLPSCFPAGTLVLTDNGYKNIENVLITDKLFTHKGNWKNIVNLQQREYNDYMFEFKLQYNSRPIKATKEHPFLVKKSGKDIYWCEAKDITTDHMMCLPINKKSIVPTFSVIRGINNERGNELYMDYLMLESMLFEPTLINTKEYKILTHKDEWILLGYFLRNGRINLESISFNLVFNGNELLHYYNMFNNLLDLSFAYENGESVIYTCNDIIWFNIMKSFGDIYNQRIPEWIQDASNEYIEWFLESYTQNNIYTSTFSVDVAYGLQRLYAKLGRMLSIEQFTDLNIYNMRVMSLEESKTYVDCNYIYYDISKINKTKDMTTVYNFEVEEDNSYTVENITVHNCHFNIQFYVTEENKERYLSCMFVMRSNDFDTANNYNVICYTLLTYILAKKYNMKPKELIYVAGDTHIYKNHIEQVKEQLTRTPRPFPKVVVNDAVKHKDWSEITVDDFELIGYFPHPTIKIPMAI